MDVLVVPMGNLRPEMGSQSRLGSELGLVESGSLAKAA